MSIAKRLADLMKANIGSLWDRSSDWDSPLGSRSMRIEELSDDELEKEVQRRKKRREAAERAAETSKSDEGYDDYEDSGDDDSGPSDRFRTAGYRTGTYRWPPAGQSSTGRDHRLARLYAQLECPYGADLATVRKCYRAMMRKYHPDMHSAEPSKQRIATELSQRLTQAYNDLVRVLNK